jgi:predicted ArsR family transcriptional regulator
MQIRDVSSALFGNEKMAEVVLAMASQRGNATAQRVADDLSVNHDLARKPMLRLVEAGLLMALPKTGGRRSAQFYEVVEGPEWDALLALCQVLAVTSPATSRSNARAGTP